MKYFSNLLKKLKHDLSLSEGKTNQAIQRKGIFNLNSREKYRRYLKSKKGKTYIRNCRTVRDTIINNTLTYILNLKIELLKYNIKLKFELLNSLQFFKIKKYSKTYTTKMPSFENPLKFWRLNSFTLKNSVIETFLRLSIEPYMEILNDKNSFGSHLKKNSYQAIVYLYNKLLKKNSNVLEIGQKQTLLYKNQSYNYWYLLCANIENYSKEIQYN